MVLGLSLAAFTQLQPAMAKGQLDDRIDLRHGAVHGDISPRGGNSHGAGDQTLTRRGDRLRRDRPRRKCIARGRGAGCQELTSGKTAVR